MKLLAWASSSIFVAIASTASSEPLTLEQAMSLIDRTPIVLDGSILFDRIEDEFRYVSAARDFYGVSVDAGREARENIEQNCEENGFMIDVDTLCRIQAIGTVEVRGARFHLSIEEVVALTPASEN